LSPRVDITPHGLHDPTMSWWTNVMRRIGGGRVSIPYNDEFFLWWHRQIIAIEDYPYRGINYRGDPDMPFPPGYAYNDICKKCFYIFHFFVFFNFDKGKLKNENIFAWYQKEIST
jgi:hypothetical protein